ncbi:MAG: sensor histidine kinase [Burkholderiaceae bacterium]|nr:sensor histidine kinase [Burkholderiaceae bacterium]
MSPAPPQPRPRASLRGRLLRGILPPLLLLIGLNAAVHYHQAREAADLAYDRTLLASAKAIGETLQVDLSTERPRAVARLPYSALDTFEADSRSRMYYKVLGFDGELVSGFDDLPSRSGALPEQNVYAALVHFYDDVYRGMPVRMAVLLQPVATGGGHGMARVQVAETLELREAAARRAMTEALWSQALLLAVVVGVVGVVVQMATRPVRALGAAIEARAENDLSPLDDREAPAELLPLLQAIHHTMDRLGRLLAHQQRFVRDAAHQLRTPLAVMKVQLQSARRGDIEPQRALDEIARTVDAATQLANQMLALARAEQLQQQPPADAVDIEPLLRGIALELAPLIAQRELDFELRSTPARVRTPPWALRELARNLIANAITHSPSQGRLVVSLDCRASTACLEVCDSGGGIPADQLAVVWEPFARASTAGRATPDAHHGSGLGLAICREIVHSLGGRIELHNRGSTPGRIDGLDARVWLPLAAEPPGPAPSS